MQTYNDLLILNDEREEVKILFLRGILTLRSEADDLLAHRTNVLSSQKGNTQGEEYPYLPYPDLLGADDYLDYLSYAYTGGY